MSEILSQDTIQFAKWLSDNTLKIPITFSIKPSRYVPRGLTCSVQGLEEALQKYVWNAADWRETKKKVNQLSANLKNAATDSHAFDSCKEILEWGGNRDRKKGALPFLKKKRDVGCLLHYLNVSKSILHLSSNSDEGLNGIELMNSMLTKVHAFYADDGLPIYDSRVACAIACLVETWRSEFGQREISDELKFPAIDRRRTVSEFGKVPNPGFLNRAKEDTTIRWTSSKVRLGRILRAVLRCNPELFENEGCLPSRMRAFEATLFMVGYCPASLACFYKAHRSP